MRIWTALAAFILIAAVSLEGQSSPQKPNRANKDGASARAVEIRKFVSQAKAAALTIKNDFQRENVLDQVGAAEARMGDFETAAATANAAYPFTMATLTALGEELARANDVAKAQTLAAKLKSGQSATIFSFIAQRQAERGTIAEALRTATLVHDPSVRSQALAWVAQKQAEAGDYAGARKTFAQAKAAYPAQGPDSDDVEIDIAQAQLGRGDKQGAHETIMSMKSADLRSSALLSSAEELFKKGDRAGSSDWLAEALSGLPEGPGAWFVRYMAIPLQVRLGQMEAALQTAGALPEEAHVKGYTAVAVTCAEIKDVAGMNMAVEKLRSGAGSRRAGGVNSDFESKLMILNIAAALIDNGEFQEASRLLTVVEGQMDEISKMTIEPEAQLLRASMLAQQGSFDEARSLALKMRPDAVANIERGTALRIVASLQTKKDGASAPVKWALALPDPEDRAYSLLGIVQVLLGIEDLKLPYNAIFVH